MASYQELSTRLAGLATDRGAGANDRAVDTAEERIGRFPGEYRAFLHEYGWVGVSSYEIYGLGDDVPPYLDVVRVTLAERTEPAVPLPANFVCVMNNGAGALISFKALDPADHDTQRSPILSWDHNSAATRVPEELAESFTDWLMDLLADQD